MSNKCSGMSRVSFIRWCKASAEVTYSFDWLITLFTIRNNVSPQLEKSPRLCPNRITFFELKFVYRGLGQKIYYHDIIKIFYNINPYCCCYLTFIVGELCLGKNSSNETDNSFKLACTIYTLSISKDIRQNQNALLTEPI